MLADKLDRLFERYRTLDDGHALARVFDLVSTDLYRFALHLSRDGERAEDLVQATFLVAIERRAAYIARGKLFSWFAGILANEYRRRRREAGREIRAERLPKRREPDVSETVAGKEAAERVQAALAGVPEPYRGVLDLELNQNLRAAAIAERLHRPRGTVRAQLTRGRELLRRLLPPGLAGLFVTLFPRAAHARAREAVLTEAGFSATTGAVSVAALKVTAILGAAAVLGAAPFLAGGEDEHALRGAAVEEIARDEGGARRAPERTPGPARVNRAPAPRRGPTAAPPRATGIWRWRLGTLGAVGPEGKAAIVALRVGELPAPWASKHLELKKSSPKLPHSMVVDEAGLGDLIAFEEMPEESTVLHGAPRDRLALVFFEGLEWGILCPLTLETDLRPTSWYRHAARCETRFALSFDEFRRPAAAPRAVLLGRDRVVRKPFLREGKRWVLEETAPLPLEVEIPLDDGTVVTAMLNSAKAGISLRDVVKDKGGKVELVEAESGLPVAGARVRLCTAVRHGPSFPLVETERGVFAVPDFVHEIRHAAVLVRAPGRLEQLVNLRRLGRGRPPVYTVAMLPAASRNGRVVENDGTPLPYARIRFRSVQWGHEMLEARSDAEGRLEYASVDFSRNGEGVQPTDLDTEIEGHVEVADGRRGRVGGVVLRSLLDGATLRMGSERRDLELVVVDADGKPVANAGVWVSLPGEHDDRLHSFHSTRHVTDRNGACRIGAIFGDRIRALVSARGRVRETFDLAVPDEGPIEITLAAARAITVELVCDREGVDLSQCTRVAIARTDGGPAAHAVDGFDEEGCMRIAAAEGARYSVTLSLNAGRRFDGTVLVAERRVFDNVTAGAVLRVPVTACRGVELDIVGHDGRRVSSALVKLDGDSPPDEPPWDDRRDGLGGAWRWQYPVSLPFGFPVITIVAPGHRPHRLPIRVVPGDDSERVVHLERGVVASGVVEVGGGGVRPPGLRFELLEIDGVDVPPKWIASHDASAGVFVPVAKDGAFVSPPLTPGRYRVFDRGTVLAEVDLAVDRDRLVLERR